jgi:hypothetical protein
MLLQCGGLKAIVKRLQGMPPPPRDLVHLAACVHALACVGAAAGQEAFRSVAGDAVSLLLVGALAQDVLLAHANQPSSNSASNNFNQHVSDSATLQLMYRHCVFSIIHSFALNLLLHVRIFRWDTDFAPPSPTPCR